MEESATLDSLIKRLIEKTDEVTALLRLNTLGPDRILEFLSFDQRIPFYLPFALEDRIQNIILRTSQFFELPLLQRIQNLVTPDSIVLDAGANIGNHSIFFSKICRAKTVYAFEPMTETYKILQRNLLINDIRNVVAHNCGLGASLGRARLIRYSHLNSGQASLAADEDGSYTVMAVDSLSLEKLDFIKIDVEGFQEEVLKGAKDTLQRCKPLIWIEMRDIGNIREFASGDALLKSLGYSKLRALTAADYLYHPI